MPARNLIAAATLLVVLSLFVPQHGLRSNAVSSAFLSSTQSQSGLEAALAWLKGEYPAWSNGYEGSVAPAAYALWLNDSGSFLASNAFSFLERELDNSSTWYWSGPYRETDVAGEILLALAASQNLGIISNQSAVSERFLHLQEASGGFEGLEDRYGHVITSSVDTAMALWGLGYARMIPSENRTAAINYLLALQNQDGSFNLTSTDVAESFYSSGPDPASITAETILALRENGFSPSETHIVKAIGYLKSRVSLGFGGIGHVYDASLSTLAFLQYYHPSEAGAALAYLLTQQNSDGGFNDVNRSGSNSNALDTGWASVALQFGVSGGVEPTTSVNQPPRAQFSFNPEVPANGTVVSFDARTTSDPDGDNLVYTWAFGDGTLASGQQVTHSYTESGVYTVTLIVTDSGSNPDRLTGTIWHDITVQASQTPTRTAAQPSTISANLELISASLLIAVAIVAGYMFIRTRKNRTAKK